MIEYYILLEYKRLTEEKERLEALLKNKAYRKIAGRNRNGRVKYCLKYTESGSIHERSITPEKYFEIDRENTEYRYLAEKIRNIEGDMAKIKAQIGQCESKVQSEFERLSAQAREQNKKFNISNYRSESKKLISARGDIVRSKSELIIADCLYFNNIYYEYESSDVIEGFHPDFYIKDNLRGIPIIWEHFGKMDDPKYSAEFVRKQKELAQRGFLSGYNLIATFEYYNSANQDASVIMDSNFAEETVNKWFMPSYVSSSERQQ